MKILHTILGVVLFAFTASAQFPPILRNQFTTNASTAGNSALVRTTAGGAPAPVTIGTGIAFDGTTLSGTGTNLPALYVNGANVAGANLVTGQTIKMTAVSSNITATIENTNATTHLAANITIATNASPVLTLNTFALNQSSNVILFGGIVTNGATVPPIFMALRPRYDQADFTAYGPILRIQPTEVGANLTATLLDAGVGTNITFTVTPAGVTIGNANDSGSGGYIGLASPLNAANSTLTRVEHVSKDSLPAAIAIAYEDVIMTDNTHDAVISAFQWNTKKGTTALPTLSAQLTGQGLFRTASGFFTNDVTVADLAYNAGTWDGSLLVPTRNAIRDRIEAMSAASGVPIQVNGTNLTVLQITNSASVTWSLGSASNLTATASGGATPGGSDTQVQYNNAGSFDGASGITVGAETNLTVTGTLQVGASTGSPIIQIGNAGVQLSDDGDGALVFLGLGNGSDEDLNLNLDDTANNWTFSSSTGVTNAGFGAIGLTSTAGFTGPLIGNAATATFASTVSTNITPSFLGVTLDAGDASFSGPVIFKQAGVTRSRIGTGFDGTSGNFNVERYNSSGVFQDIPFTIATANGAATLSSNLTVGGSLRVNGITNNVFYNAAGTHFLTNDANGFAIDRAPNSSYSLAFNGGVFAGGAAVVAGASPIASLAHDLGSSGNQWRTLYVSNVTASGTITATNAVLVTPTATTPSANDNDTSVATTAYVQSEMAANVVRSMAIPMGAWFTNGISGSLAIQTNLTGGSGDTWSFADGVTNSVRILVPMPVTWDAGTVKFSFDMGSTGNNTSSTNTVYSLRAASITSNAGDVATPTWGTSITFTNHISAVSNRLVTCITGPLTIGNTPAINKQVLFELTRMNADATDVNTNNIQVAGSQLFYSTITDPVMPTTTQ